MQVGGVLRAAICSLVAIYMIVPLVIVIVLSFSSAQFLQFPPPGWSFQWYRNLYEDPQWYRSFVTSIQILIPTSILATSLGTAAAYGLARTTMPGTTVIRAFLTAPIVVPVIITAAGVFGVFRGFGLYGTLHGLILAHTVLTIPFVVATVSAGLKVVDSRLESAAWTLGARRITAFRRITLPLIFPSVISGLLFSMVISFDELIVSLFLSTSSVRPVTVQMWSNIRGAVDPTVAAVATILFVFSLCGLLIDHVLRSKQEAGK